MNRLADGQDNQTELMRLQLEKQGQVIDVLMQIVLQQKTDKERVKEIFDSAMKSGDFVPVSSPVSSETSYETSDTERKKTINLIKSPSDMAKDFLDQNPDIERSHTLRELEEISGISYSTIRRVLKKMGRM